MEWGGWEKALVFLLCTAHRWGLAASGVVLAVEVCTGIAVLLELETRSGVQEPVAMQSWPCGIRSDSVGSYPGVKLRPCPPLPKCPTHQATHGLVQIWHSLQQESWLHSQTPVLHCPCQPQISFSRTALHGLQQQKGRGS